MGDRVDKITALIAVALVVLGNIYYCIQCLGGAVAPTLAAWIVLEIGTSLSLATYWKYDRARHQVISNIANVTDPVMVAIVLSFLAFSPRVNAAFGFWNFACLAIAVCAVAVWRITRSALEANIVSQFVMLVGYIPMILRIIRERENKDSFALWIIWTTAGLFFLVSPVRHKNWLGILYIGRALLCVTALIAVAIYYQFFRDIPLRFFFRILFLSPR